MFDNASSKNDDQSMPWLFLTIHLYQPSFLVRSPDDTQYPHKTEYKFLQVN